MRTHTARFFIAVNLSESHKEDLERIQMSLTTTTYGFRWVASNRLHITLLFCDNQTQDTIDHIARCITSELRGFPPFEIRLTGVGAFPNSCRPRILWVGVSEGSAHLNTLQRIVRTAAIQSGLSLGNEPLPFHPHVTIARAKKESRTDLGNYSHLQKLSVNGCTCVNSIEVMRSHLTPQGPIYEVDSILPLNNKCSNHI